MPIPTRPIPSSSRSRPGTTVPRKSLPSSQLHHLDWRSELALLSDLPRSAPGNIGSGSGVRVVDKAKALRDKAGMERDRGGAFRREVDIEGMIVGKGRVKRATTATSLGFDFVVKPIVLALPEEAQSNPTSLLTATKGTKMNIPNPYTNTPDTPTSTPSLVSAQVVEDEEDEEWEHVLSSPQLEAEDNLETEDEDVIVLGELEMEDEKEVIDVEKGGKAKVKGLSYAAVLGAGKA